jgi:hypothetical protein
MNRRAFLMMTAASAIAGTALPHMAQAYTSITFTPEEWNRIRETDQTVILNWRASWSLTCQIKLELIAKLIGENPAYSNLTFVDIDWDHFGQSVMTNRLKVTRRSTLVVMKSGREITRIENQPFERKVRGLLDAALAA